MQLIPASKELAPGSDENTRADRDVSPADLEARHVQSGTHAASLSVWFGASPGFFLDWQQLRDSGRVFQPKPEDLLHPDVEILRRPLEALDRPRQVAEVIHEGVAADNVRHELPTPLGALLVKVPQGVAHRIVKKPRIQIAADDEVAAWSNPAEIGDDRMKLVSLRQLGLDEAEHDHVLCGLVGMNDVGLPDVPDAESLT